MQENPYESPQNPDPPGSPKKGSPGRIVGAVVLGLLAVPAAAIAFFTTCLMTYDATRSDVLPWIVGVIAGVAVGGPFVYIMIRLVRR